MARSPARTLVRYWAVTERSRSRVPSLVRCSVPSASGQYHICLAHRSGGGVWQFGAECHASRYGARRFWRLAEYESSRDIGALLGGFGTATSSPSQLGSLLGGFGNSASSSLTRSVNCSVVLADTQWFATRLVAGRICGQLRTGRLASVTSVYLANCLASIVPPRCVASRIR